MNKLKNLITPGVHQKPMAIDVFYKDKAPRPTIIYAHGFNGFKDWGNFNLIAEQFVQAGFTFVKFNFSHNGTSPASPEEFVDLDAYAQNNYSIELEDLNTIVNWSLSTNNPALTAVDEDALFLIGHSMGGGIVLVHTSTDPRIKGVATWASVGVLTTPWGKWTEEKIESWKQDGVAFIKNGRTGQDMPLKYQLYEDFQNNQNRLSVEKAVSTIGVPILFCHGTEDEAVPVETTSTLASLNSGATIFTLNTDHVFGRKHPWNEMHLPDATQQIISETIEFFKSC